MQKNYNTRLSVYDVRFKERTEVELEELLKHLLSLLSLMDSIEARAIVQDAIVQVNADLDIRKAADYMFQ